MAEISHRMGQWFYHEIIDKGLKGRVRGLAGRLPGQSLLSPPNRNHLVRQRYIWQLMAGSPLSPYTVPKIKVIGRGLPRTRREKKR